MLEPLHLNLRPFAALCRCLGLALVTAGLCSTATASPLFSSPSSQSSHNARAWAIPGPPQVAPGESFELYVRIVLEKGWHIYSLEAEGDGESLATVIRMDENLFPGQEKWKEPDPKIILDQALNKIVKTHQGTVEFVRSYQAPPGLKPGTYPVRGALLFRACDNRVCSLPNEVPFSAQIIVVDAAN